MAKVLVPTKISAENVDALNRSGVCAEQLENGDVLVCGVQSEDAKQKDVFAVTKPESAVAGLWMAYEPEVVDVIDGRNVYRGLNADPRSFVIPAGRTFSMFKPVEGVDLIQITKDFFAEDKDPATVTGATVVELNASGKWEAKVSATNNYAGMSWKIFAKKPIIIANGVIGGEGVDAWILECAAN